jgi:hypothetical protein
MEAQGIRPRLANYAEKMTANLKHATSTNIPTREKLILVGLYLSKYDLLGVRKLGFESFVEAFNVIGYALGSKPANIKNYRDEFDPLFSNPRKGWHKRTTRDYCLAVLENYKGLDFETFTGLVGSFFGYDQNADSVNTASPDERDEATSCFAQRLITGLAAEHYFESVQGGLPEFKGYIRENTTRLGCGYDFRLSAEPDDKEFLAVEVKGMKSQTGNLVMTPKEYRVAESLRSRFFLFVVRNFRESPSHEIFQNPLSGPLQFRKIERVTVQISWLTSA